MANRIKQIRKKNNNQFDAAIPIGVDSQYVDMVSGANLEQELYIGCPHKVIISTTEAPAIINGALTENSIAVTSIQQWYFKKGASIPSSLSSGIGNTSCIYYKNTNIPETAASNFAILSTVTSATTSIITTISFDGDNISEIQGGN